VASDASHLSDDPVIMVTNPDEDCSPGTFRAFLDELLAGSEPDLDNIGATEALRELRVDTDA